jgi:hypothetical protein
MNTITTTLTTEAVFDDTSTKRYLLKKTWDNTLPSLTIIMLAPSIASGVAMDSTTTLVLNNASALGFGSVSIVNLFATLGDFSLSAAEPEDPDNLKAILSEAKDADVIIYAPGVGKNKLQVFQERSTQVLTALRPYEKKIKCLTSATGKARLLHPLCPAVRSWHIAELRFDELLSTTDPVEPKSPSKKKSGPKVIKKEVSA